MPIKKLPRGSVYVTDPRCWSVGKLIKPRKQSLLIIMRSNQQFRLDEGRGAEPSASKASPDPFAEFALGNGPSSGQDPNSGQNTDLSARSNRRRLLKKLVGSAGVVGAGMLYLDRSSEPSKLSKSSKESKESKESKRQRHEAKYGNISNPTFLPATTKFDRVISSAYEEFRDDRLSKAESSRGAGDAQQSFGPAGDEPGSDLERRIDAELTSRLGPPELLIRSLAEAVTGRKLYSTVSITVLKPGQLIQRNPAIEGINNGIDEKIFVKPFGYAKTLVILAHEVGHQLSPLSEELSYPRSYDFSEGEREEGLASLFEVCVGLAIEDPDLRDLYDSVLLTHHVNKIAKFASPARDKHSTGAALADVLRFKYSPDRAYLMLLQQPKLEPEVAAEFKQYGEWCRKLMEEE